MSFQKSLQLTQTEGEWGPGGKVLIMSSYKLDVINMISNLLSSPVAYIYYYLRKVFITLNHIMTS
jgi:hypothetical protein